LIISTRKFDGQILIPIQSSSTRVLTGLTPAVPQPHNAMCPSLTIEQLEKTLLTLRSALGSSITSTPMESSGTMWPAITRSRQYVNLEYKSPALVSALFLTVQSEVHVVCFWSKGCLSVFICCDILLKNTNNKDKFRSKYYHKTRQGIHTQ
jgi:hypothetical protein